MPIFTLPSNDELRYHGLMAIWERDTAHLSIGHERHPAFQEIVSLKDKIPLVKLLLADVWEYSWLAMTVLWAVVDDPPVVSDKDRGRLMPVTELWLKWGQEKGYGNRDPDCRSNVQ